MDNSKRQSILIYLPSELKEQIQLAAKLDRRSVTAWVEVQLEQALKQSRVAK
jgi:predicted HicB family RNase H-like nuclease